MADATTHVAAVFCGGLLVHWFEALGDRIRGPDYEACSTQGCEGQLACRCLEAVEQLGPKETNGNSSLASWALVVVVAIAFSSLSSKVVETFRTFEFRLHAAPTRQTLTQTVADRLATEIFETHPDDHLDALDLDNYVPRRA